MSLVTKGCEVLFFCPVLLIIKRDRKGICLSVLCNNVCSNHLTVLKQNGCFMVSGLLYSKMCNMLVFK